MWPLLAVPFSFIVLLLLLSLFPLVPRLATTRLRYAVLGSSSRSSSSRTRLEAYQELDIRSLSRSLPGRRHSLIARDSRSACSSLLLLLLHLLLRFFFRLLPLLVRVVPILHNTNISQPSTSPRIPSRYKSMRPCGRPSSHATPTPPAPTLPFSSGSTPTGSRTTPPSPPSAAACAS